MEENKDKHILSTLIPYGKNSFMKGSSHTTFNPKMPPPVNLNYKLIELTRDIELRDIMEGTIIPQKGGF